ncbi:MAG: polysaccharide deacetylase family protein [Armatimonadota bacterium]|nr:polysaccharide deacetylase family protein [Armatimonadota bacterium]
MRDAAFAAGLVDACTRALNALWRRARSGVYVFSGHHVFDDRGRDPSLRGKGIYAGLTAQDLFDRLTYLHRHFDIVTVETALEWLDRPTPGARLAVITFDDGYRNNLVNGLPVLRSTGAPATVFVCTHPVLSGRTVWFAELRAVVQASVGKRFEVSWMDGPIDIRTPGQVDQVTGEMAQVLRRDGPDSRTARMQELYAAAGTDGQLDISPDLMLTPEDLSLLGEEPLVTIGAHTHTHTILPSCAEPEMAEELEANMGALERLVGKRPTVFAYPNGETDTSAKRIPVVLEEAGIRAAFTTQKRVNTPERDRLRLGRFPLGHGPLAQFAWELLRIRF